WIKIDDRPFVREQCQRGPHDAWLDRCCEFEDVVAKGELFGVLVGEIVERQDDIEQVGLDDGWMNGALRNTDDQPCSSGTVPHTTGQNEGLVQVVLRCNRADNHRDSCETIRLPMSTSPAAGRPVCVDGSNRTTGTSSIGKSESIGGAA